MAGSVTLTAPSVDEAPSVSHTVRIVPGSAAANVTGGTAPTLSYTDGTGVLTDDTGNQVANFSTQTAADGAAPIVVTRQYQDNGSNGSVDRLVLTLSETVTWNGSDLSQFAVVANDLTGFSGNPTTVAGSASSTLTLMPTTSNLTGAVTTQPTVAYTQSGTTANRVVDARATILRRLRQPPSDAASPSCSPPVRRMRTWAYKPTPVSC